MISLELFAKSWLLIDHHSENPIIGVKEKRATSVLVAVKVIVNLLPVLSSLTCTIVCYQVFNYKLYVYCSYSNSIHVFFFSFTFRIFILHFHYVKPLTIFKLYSYSLRTSPASLFNISISPLNCSLNAIQLQSSRRLFHVLREAESDCSNDLVHSAA